MNRSRVFTKRNIPWFYRADLLMLNEIITVYAIMDDLLKAIGHSEDSRR